MLCAVFGTVNCCASATLVAAYVALPANDICVTVYWPAGRPGGGKNRSAEIIGDREDRSRSARSVHGERDGLLRKWNAGAAERASERATERLRREIRRRLRHHQRSRRRRLHRRLSPANEAVT